MSKKLFLTLSMALVFGLSAFAQTYRILVQPAGVKEWGYTDLTGNLVIDAKYKKCIGFSEEGLAAIYDSKEKAFFFIDVNGERLPTEVDDYKLIEVFGFGMKGFNSGFAPVKIGEKWGFLNVEGKLAITANYDKVTIFNGGLASVQRDEKFFVIDKNGMEFPVEIPGIVDLNDFSEQLASYKTAADLVGFVDESGRKVIEAQFKAAGDFHGGIAWAKNVAGTVGYINTKGDWIIEPQFDAGKNYDSESGLARVKKGESWAYVNKAGEINYMLGTDLFEDFMDGLARGRKDGKFGYFNAKMEWAIQPQYDGGRDFKNGYASVRTGELWGVIDGSGKVVIEPKFEDIKDVEVIK
jgi:hypothetical protein